MVLHAVATDGCSLLILVTTGSMRRYLQPSQVAQVSRMAHPYMWSGLLFLPVQSQEHGAETKKPDVTWGEADKAVEGHQPSSRTGICSFVRGGTWRALPEPYKMTFGGLLVCMFPTVRNGLHEGGMRARHPPVRPELTAQHRSARLAFTWEHQNQ